MHHQKDRSRHLHPLSISVEFRLIVFRPFKGEILEGTLHDCDPTGITIHLDFFNDIWVPCPANVFENSHL